MESSGLPGRIQLSEQTAAMLDDDFEIEERGMVEIKGKGLMKTFWLLGHRQPEAPAALQADEARK
jgi:adenylate cyclase